MLSVFTRSDDKKHKTKRTKGRAKNLKVDVTDKNEVFPGLAARTDDRQSYP